MRRIESPEKFFDLMDTMRGGGIITIGYVTGANLDIPKIKRKNPLTNRMKNFPDYSVFKNDESEDIGALVKITTYNFNYRNRKSVKDEYYNSIVPKTNDIRHSVGLEPINHRQSYKDVMNYGDNGIETYGGNNDELRGHNYYPQNMYKPHNISSTVYIVNGEGHITRSLSKEQILPYLKAKKIDGVSALKKMGAEESVIKDYIKRLEELKFSYKNFEADSILYIVATVNGEKLIYLNSNLKRCVDDININPTDFLAIAREKYKKDLNENKSLKQKNTIKLTEEDLHFIIKESVTKILEENFNIKKTTDKIKKGVKNFGNGIKDGLKKVKQKYDDEVERVLNAPNPLYDDDEEFDESDN